MLLKGLLGCPVDFVVMVAPTDGCPAVFESLVKR